MGRIKTSFVKRISDELLKRFPEYFTENFEENKARVKEVLDYPSKKVINQVAGYITRKVKNKKDY
jgi:small subunit ribosomal protein S17e